MRRAASGGAAAGEAFRDGLFESVETLSRLPFLGPVYEKDATGQTREVTYRQYRIFYRVVEAEK